MKKQFQSKSVPQGTRTIWRYLGALILLFSLSIGQMWGVAPATSSDSKTVSGTVTFADVTSLSAQTTYWYNGVKLYSYAATNASAANSLWTSAVTSGVYYSSITAGSSWGSYAMSGLVMAQHAVAAHVKGEGTITVVVNNTRKDYATFDSNFKAYRVAANKYGDNYTTSTYKNAESGTEITSGLSISCESGKGRYTISYDITDDMLDANDEVIIKFYYGSSGTGAGKWFCYESVTFTPATSGPVDPTITFNNGAYTVGDAGLNLSSLFSSNSAGAVTYSVKTDGGTGASISGTTFTATAAGTCVVTASQAAETGKYNAKAVDANIVVSAACTKPDAPISLVVKDGTLTYNSATLSWDPSGAGANGYKIALVSASGAGTFDWEDEATNAYEATGLTPATNYTFKVKYKGGAGECEFSDEVTEDFTTEAEPVPAIGDATITYALSGSTATGTVSGVSSISGLSTSLTLSTLTLSGTKDGYSGAIKGCTSATELVEADYVDVQFTVASGYVFTPSAVSVKVNPFTATGAVKAVVALQDAALDIRSEVLSCAKSTDNAVTFASGAFTNKKFEGTVHLRMYFYGPASDKTFYLKSPISITGTVAVAPTKYNVNFDKNDEGAGGSQTTLKYEAGAEVTLPACTFVAPTGKEFDAWTSTDVTISDGKFTMPSNAVTIKATWKALVAKYTVIFKDGDVTLDTKQFDVASNPSDADIEKTKPLYTFAAWQKDAADIALDDAFWASVAANAEVTLTARWTALYALDVNFKDAATQELGVETALNTYHYASDASDISFEAKGLKIKTNAARFYFNVAPGKVAEIKFGDISGATYSVNGGDAETLSASQLKATYSASAQSCVMTMTTAAYNIVEKVTIHDPYQVTFDGNGADSPVAPQYAYPSVTLPSATKGTESFLGWFDDATAGNKIGDAGASYTPTADITLYAHWEAISTDNTLSDLKVGGVTVDGFDPAVNTYYVVLPYGTAVGDIPAISATANSPKAKQVAIQQAVWTGDPYNCYRAQANVQAEDESWGYYDVRFSFGPKDGVSIIKVATTGGTNKTVTGAYAGDGDVSLSSNTKMDDGKYIGFILEGTTLQAGDKINVHTTEAANTGGSHIIFYDNMTDKNELYETGEIGGVGDNIFTINAAMVGATTAYVYRSNADNAHKWNGKVNYIEVTRAMDPVLTAITIDGRDGVIDEEHKTVAVQIPHEAVLSSLTVVPTIIRNAAHATTPEAVISNEGAWIEGANTYRVMDKDGDYTDYTITLTRDVLKHTVSFNTHGGSAVASELVEDGGYLAAAPADPTKEDYIFQYWSEDEDGAEVDVTTVQINADKEFHAVWASDGAIKLIEAGAINNVNFYTGAVMGTEPATVSIDDVDRVYAILNSAASSPSGVNALNKLIAYNATTTQTKVMVEVYNSSTSGRNVYIKGVLEGSDEVQDLANIVLDNGTKKYVKSEYFEFNNTANRTIYISVPSSASSVYFLQVKVIESGEPLKKAGEAGYSLNMNKGRMFASSEVIDGATLEMSSAYSAISSSAAKFKETSISFDVAAPVTLTVTAANNKTYYVTKGAAGTDNETAKTGVSEFDLTAGTWYITAGNSEVQFTNIAFEAPKCAEPVIDDEPASNTNVTVGDNLTASVTAHATDGADLAYQWYNADGDVAVIGATTATLTTTTEGTYYVIITASKSGYDDRTAQSQNATLAYRDNTIATLSALSYGGTAITLEDGVYEYNVYLAMGTTDVPALAATATQAAYGATAVPTDATEFVSYEAISTVLVTAEDGVTQKTYTVHFYVDHIYSELVPVTASTTWNWSGSEEAVINDVANKGLIIANYIDGANFEMIEGKENERARRNQNGGVYQGTHLHFNTTVAGKVKFYFRAPSSGENCTITVINNGKAMTAGTRGNSFGWSKEIVVKGDVVIEMENDKAGGGDTRVQQIVFTEDAPDYSRTVSNNIGTLCVDHNVLVGGAMGATFYQIASRNEQYNDKIDFEEVLPGEELKAGEPYIFQSTTGRIDLFYGATVADDPVAVRGMHGVLADGSSLTITEENKMDVYYIQDNKLRDCSNLSSLTLVKNRAYIVMSEVPTFAEYQEAQSQQSNNAPRRRVTLGRDAEQVATGCENLNVSDKPVKMILNGQLFILRGEKMFDATGRLVK